MSQLRLDLPPDVKPPFRIPTMAEIEAEPPNGHDVVSLFSGCGGSCLGFRMAGFRTLYASEFVPAAAETYQANHSGVILDRRDIRDVDPRDVLEQIGRFPGEVSVLEGSPPCSSFSMAGKREEGWGAVKKYSDVEQRTDDLFDEYVRLVAGIKPKVFVAENVTGLVTDSVRKPLGVSLDGLDPDAFRDPEATKQDAPSADVTMPAEYLNEILGKLGKLGYAVQYQILNAARFGVPQARRRLILIGVRRDVGRPAWPDPLPYTYSIRDALPEIEAVQSLYGFDGHAFYSSDRPAETIPQRPGGTKLVEVRRLTGKELVDGNVAPTLEHFAIGAAYDRLKPDGNAHDESKSDDGVKSYFNLVRPDPEKPAPTVTQTGGNPGAASIVHPTEKRKFTMNELRRLSGFPEDFVLTGSYSQQWERLGRAVPPLLMAAIARTIRDRILALP